MYDILYGDWKNFATLLKMSYSTTKCLQTLVFFMAFIEFKPKDLKFKIKKYLIYVEKVQINISSTPNSIQYIHTNKNMQHRHVHFILRSILSVSSSHVDWLLQVYFAISFHIRTRWPCSLLRILILVLAESLFLGSCTWDTWIFSNKNNGRIVKLSHSCGLKVWFWPLETNWYSLRFDVRGNAINYTSVKS